MIIWPGVLVCSQYKNRIIFIACGMKIISINVIEYWIFLLYFLLGFSLLFILNFFFVLSIFHEHSQFGRPCLEILNMFISIFYRFYFSLSLFLKIVPYISIIEQNAADFKLQNDFNSTKFKRQKRKTLQKIHTSSNRLM